MAALAEGTQVGWRVWDEHGRWYWRVWVEARRGPRTYGDWRFGPFATQADAERDAKDQYDGLFE